MSKYRSARELLLRILFQVDVGHLPLEEVLETAWEQVEPSPLERRYVEETIHGILEEQAELDRYIEVLAEGWRVDRLAKVDKNVLRAALYELLHRTEIPIHVIINDAVEIAKRYSTEDSGRFVNGILGSFVRRREELVPERAGVGAS